MLGCSKVMTTGKVMTVGQNAPKQLIMTLEEKYCIFQSHDVMTLREVMTA